MRPFRLHLRLGLLLLLAPGFASAAQVVIVKTSDAEPYMQTETALRARLGEQHHQVSAMLMKEVSDRGIGATLAKAEVVVAIGTPAARWLHMQLPPRAKLVYCMVNNPEEAGLTQGPIVGGVTTEVAPAAQIKVISEALPRARTLGLLYRSDTPDGKKTLDSFKASIPAEWKVQAVAVNEHPSIASAIDALIQKSPDIIWTSADQKVFDTAAVRALLLAALRSKIPVWGFSPAFVRAGALLGVGVEPRAQGEQAAEITLRAIAGRCTIGDLAQPPRQFHIAVNLIVARQIGVEIPDTLTRRAAYVYRPEN